MSCTWWVVKWLSVTTKRDSLMKETILKCMNIGLIDMLGFKITSICSCGLILKAFELDLEVIEFSVGTDDLVVAEVSVMFFLTKDRTLAIPLLEGLLKYWPFAYCIKETLFLTELQEVFIIDKLSKLVWHSENLFNSPIPTDF